MNQSSTTQKFSSNSSREMRRFIFNRLQQTDNQKTLYNLRLIQKSEQGSVEKKIQTAKIDFCDLEKFATSKFSQRIKFLEVCFRIWQDSFESFKYLSNNYLPYALNITAKVFPSFHEEIPQDGMSLEMRESLTFRNLHVVEMAIQWHSGFGYTRDNYFILNLRITGKYNVQIQDCEFIGINVSCKGNANVYVTGSKFIKGWQGLQIGKCDSVYIDEITLDQVSRIGLRVDSVKEVINITNVCVFSCPDCGIYIHENGAKFKLSNTIIKNCGDGICIQGSCCGEIQKTNIEGCKLYGIYLIYGAIVHYAAVEFKNNKQDVYIHDDDSQFLQRENI